MSVNAGLIGTALLDKMADQLSTLERQAFDDGVSCGFLRVHAEQRDLQRLWTLWCMRNQRPDIRVEQDGADGAVSMHLGPCQTTLSADGMHAIKRLFGRYCEDTRGYQTNNWCKHPHVPSEACDRMAGDLAEIAFLDGVPRDA